MIIVIEILIFFLIKISNQKSNWILTENDELISLDKNKIKNFFKNSYHPELGWSTLTKKKIIEKTNNGHIEILFDKKGSRYIDTKFTKTDYSIYGDSYALSRNVGAKHSVQYFLSQKLNSNIDNYGVGGYGIDQVYKLIQNNITKDKNKNIIIIIVPETIVRIRSYWSHYYSFKNYFAFKPIFNLIDDNLIETKNYLFDKNKIFDIKNNLNFIRKNDFFYKYKYKKFVFKFPYLFNLFSKRKSLILYKCLKNLKKKNLNAYLRPHIMKNNFQIQTELYKDSYSKELLSKIFFSIKNLCDKNNKKYLIFFAPQLFDIQNQMYKDINYTTYVNYLKKKGLKIYDLTNNFESKKNLFVHQDHLGYHYNKYGNKILADKISNIISLLDG